MATRKSKRGDFEIEELGEYEMTPEQDDEATELIERAEKTLEECRVNFRWSKEPLQVIKQVAEQMGVPYQTYMKMVLYKQAIADLETMNKAAAMSSPEQRPTGQAPPKL